jgi:hypothetical protein
VSHGRDSEDVGSERPCESERLEDHHIGCERPSVADDVVDYLVDADLRETPR